MHITSGFSHRLSATVWGAALSLLVSAAGLPLTATAASPDVAAPNSIIVDRMPSPIEANGAGAFHAGQFVQYRVRYYDASGNLAPCNASGQPQVLQHNPANGAVIDRAWGAGTPGSGVVNVVMGGMHGAGSLEVSCNGAVKRVLVSNDGEAIVPSQQAANDKLIQDNPIVAAAPPAAAPPAPQVAPQPAPQFAPQPAPGPAPAAAGGSGSGALLVAGIVALGVVGAVAIAAAASNSSSGSDSSCASGSHQCSPPNSSVCCPDGTAIYCTNNNTCTNQTLDNFSDICGSGSNATADGC